MPAREGGVGAPGPFPRWAGLRRPLGPESTAPRRKQVGAWLRVGGPTGAAWMGNGGQSGLRTEAGRTRSLPTPRVVPFASRSRALRSIPGFAESVILDSLLHFQVSQGGSSPPTGPTPRGGDSVPTPTPASNLSPTQRMTCHAHCLSLTRWGLMVVADTGYKLSKSMDERVRLEGVRWEQSAKYRNQSCEAGDGTPTSGRLWPQLGKWLLLLKPGVCWGRRGRGERPHESN